MMSSSKNIVCLFILFIIASCSTSDIKSDKTNQVDILRIYAAAGTRTAIEDVSMLVSAKDSIKIEANYASSGTLARQIANGAECDVYISANKQWIDFLLEKDVLIKNSVQIIAKSSLVVISPLDVEVELPDFSPDMKYIPESRVKIAVGNPEYVPVGKYAKMVFDTLGWYESLKPSMVMCKDVSSVRHYVELGECDWGVVYYTEAIQSDKLKIVSEIPKDLYKPINFYVALIKNGNRILGEKYIDVLIDTEGQSVLENMGFATDVK